ncbi:hypothetical protein [Natronolimnobius baerhuensis]|nr:hypothetical protein [Natronolimnobius baerhuensis]
MQLTRRTLVAFGGLFGLGVLERLYSTVAAGESDDDAAACGNETVAESVAAGEESDGSDEGSNDEDGDDEAWTLPDDSPLEEIATVSVDALEEEGLEDPMLSITNTDSEARSVSVRIDSESDTALEETNDIPGESVLEVVAGESGTYETTVESGSLQSTTSITASGECPAHTEITLGDSGVRMNTSMRC